MVQTEPFLRVGTVSCTLHPDHRLYRFSRSIDDLVCHNTVDLPVSTGAIIVVGSSLTSTHQLAQLDRYTCCLVFYRIGVGSQGGDTTAKRNLIFLLIALNGIIFIFVVIRGLDSVGYRLRPNVDDWKYACLYLGLFVSFFAIPIGFSTSFIHQTSEWQPFWKFPVILLGIFLFTGLPEEILFRGLIHNLLAGWMRKGNRSELPALLISSIIFGLAHVNNSNPPFILMHLFGTDWLIPWAYVSLATIAGWFYGLAYIRTRSFWPRLFYMPWLMDGGHTSLMAIRQAGL